MFLYSICQTYLYSLYLGIVGLSGFVMGLILGFLLGMFYIRRRHHAKRT